MNREATAFTEAMETATDRIPAVYLGHGAPPLVDDEVWVSQLHRWAADLPKPKAILVVSAHWESAPLTLGATRPFALIKEAIVGPFQRLQMAGQEGISILDTTSRSIEELATTILQHANLQRHVY